MTRGLSVWVSGTVAGCLFYLVRFLPYNTVDFWIAVVGLTLEALHFVLSDLILTRTAGLGTDSQE